MKRTKSEQSVLSTKSSPHQWPSSCCWRKRFCWARVIASEISASAATNGSDCSALRNATMFREEFIEDVDLTMAAERCRLYEAWADFSAFLPVRCPFPIVTPLKATVSLPRPVGFGFGPKLNLIVFQVSPRFDCSPSEAVGS